MARAMLYDFIKINEVTEMKVAIPMFQKRVSPCFECAPRFLLVDITNDQVVEIDTVGWSANDRIKKFAESGVDTVICGGIDKMSARRLEHQGIKVHSWVSGEATDALRCLVRGKMDSEIMVGPNGCRRGRWHFHKGKATKVS
jgi:predicted Fe-Mo cluster-binding NifX family protein